MGCLAQRLHRKLETGNWKLETGNWKLETGNWKLERVFGRDGAPSPSVSRAWLAKP
jgi:hypothetical protein